MVIIAAAEQCLIAGVGRLGGLLAKADTLAHMLDASARCKLVALDEHTHIGRQATCPHNFSLGTICCASD